MLALLRRRSPRPEEVVEAGVAVRPEPLNREAEDDWRGVETHSGSETLLLRRYILEQANT